MKSKKHRIKKIYVNNQQGAICPLTPQMCVLSMFISQHSFSCPTVSKHSGSPQAIQLSGQQTSLLEFSIPPYSLQ